MASQSTGIQQLLAAEKKAAEKVSEARKRKARRLKQAKEEAQAEVEAYRRERERQYKEHEQKILGSRGDTETQIGEATKGKLVQIQKHVAANQDKARQRILALVCDIKPELHQNLRL